MGADGVERGPGTEMGGGEGEGAVEALEDEIAGLEDRMGQLQELSGERMGQLQVG